MDPLALVGPYAILQGPNLQAAWKILNTFNLSKKLIENENYTELIRQGMIMKQLSAEFVIAVDRGRNMLDSVSFVCFCNISHNFLAKFSEPSYRSVEICVL